MAELYGELQDVCRQCEYDDCPTKKNPLCKYCKRIAVEIERRLETGDLINIIELMSEEEQMEERAAMKSREYSDDGR